MRDNHPVHIDLHIAAPTNRAKTPQTSTSRAATCADDTHAPTVRLRRPRPSTLLPQLNSHHWSILELLDSEPLLGTGHICALLFTQGTPLSRARICRRVLREFADWGLVYRQRPVPARPGGGSEHALHSITTAGRRTLALRDGREPTRATRPDERGQGTRLHLLALADLRVELELRAREQGVEMRWTPEPACWWRFAYQHRTELLKPDAYVEIDHPTETRLAWIELDRGTQSVPHTIQAKIRRYCRAALARQSGRRAVPRVIYIVDRRRRRDAIRRYLPGWTRGEGLDGPSTTALFSLVNSEIAAEHLLAR